MGLRASPTTVFPSGFSKTVTAVRDYINATTHISVTAQRSVLGQSDLDELWAHHDRINERLRDIIDEHTEERWEVQVVTVEVKDVLQLKGFQRAIARRAEAEREKQARTNRETRILGQFVVESRLL